MPSEINFVFNNLLDSSPVDIINSNMNFKMPEILACSFLK